MNRKSLLACLFLGSLFLFFGCSKRYDEDPITMKFVSLKKRISGEWKISKILINGADSTSIIDVDSLQIFSTYIFTSYSNNHRDGNLEVKTKNRNHTYNRLEFIFAQTDKSNSIVFYPADNADSWDYLLQKKIIIPYGPINNFYTLTHNWDIHMLTKKEMHLSINESNKKYELFLKKI